MSAEMLMHPVAGRTVCPKLGCGTVTMKAWQDKHDNKLKSGDNSIVHHEQVRQMRDACQLRQALHQILSAELGAPADAAGV